MLLVRRGQGCPVLVAAGSSTPRAQLSPSATMVAPLGKYIFKRAKTSQKPVIHREEERKESTRKSSMNTKAREEGSGGALHWRR